jgi:hypothetical protein
MSLDNTGVDPLFLAAVGASLVIAVTSGGMGLTGAGAVFCFFRTFGASTGFRPIGLGLEVLAVGLSDFSNACDIFPTIVP